MRLSSAADLKEERRSYRPANLVRTVSARLLTHIIAAAAPRVETVTTLSRSVTVVWAPAGEGSRREDRL
jgi:hypothetical protein